MKKLIVGLVAAALMSFGLVGGATAPVHADPYTGTVPTAPAKKVVKSKVGKAPKIKLKSTSGTAKPKGTSKVVCNKGKKVAKAKGKVKNGVVKAPKLKSKGTWTCKVQFVGKGVFKSSKTKVKVKVV
jgi:hypothetical protein